MAYRAIHTKIWDDYWFIEQLGPEGKLLWLWLCTNGSTNIIGVYELSLRKATGETGLPSDIIKALLDEFEQAGKVMRDGSWVWVRNLMRYNAGNRQSPNVKIGIDRALADVPANVIKSAFCEYYTIDIPSTDHPPTVPLHTSSSSSSSSSDHNHHQDIIITGADAPEPHDDDVSIDDDDGETLPKPEESDKALVAVAVSALLERNWNAGEKKAAEFVTKWGPQYILDMCEHAARVGLEAGWIREYAGSFTPGQKWESRAERQARVKNRGPTGLDIATGWIDA